MFIYFFNLLQTNLHQTHGWPVATTTFRDRIRVSLVALHKEHWRKNVVWAVVILKNSMTSFQTSSKIIASWYIAVIPWGNRQQWWELPAFIIRALIQQNPRVLTISFQLIWGTTLTPAVSWTPPAITRSVGTRKTIRCSHGRLHADPNSTTYL